MSKADAVYEFVGWKLNMLQRGDSWSKAMLARLRRGAGKAPSEVPEVWEVTMGGLPNDLTSKYDDLRSNTTPADWAIHIALTLYATHQQGKANPVDKRGTSFASAMRAMAQGSNEEAIKKRFDAILTAEDLAELSHHARSMVQIIRSSEKPLTVDYSELARDLYWFQYPEGRSRVRLKWGRDFYRLYVQEDNEKE